MEKQANIIHEGRILESYGSSSSVLCNGKMYNCSLRGKLRLTLKATHSPVSVGDIVKVLLQDDTTGVIEELVPRQNKISRPTRIGAVKERIIAANVDILAAVIAAKEPMLKTGLIDRMLLVAEREGVKAVICLNKWDLVEPGEFDDIVDVYSGLGYDIVKVSALNGEGVEELNDLLKNKFSVFIGQSGVGKTTLLNCIVPGLERKTQEVSGYNDKGRHTTSSVTVVQLENGGLIADTPGFRNFGIWGVKQEVLANLYPEFRALEDDCKYQPCSHYHEPKCAVQDALEAGKISPMRYDNYCRIYESYDEELGDIRY